MARRGHSTSDYLFSKADIHSVQAYVLDKVRRTIEEASAAEIQTGSVEDVVQHYVNEFRLEPPVLTEGAVSVDVEETQVDISQDRNWQFMHGYFHGDRTTTPGIRATFYVPFTGDPEMFNVRPSTYTTTWPAARIEDHELVLVFERTDQDIAGAKGSFDHELKNVKQYLGWLTDNANTFNRDLPVTVKQHVEARRRRLGEVQTGTRSLGIQIRKAPGSDHAPRKLSTMPAKPQLTEHYDVALSFAGEDRDYVEKVATELKDAGVKVFYDNFEKSQLWGKNLIDHLAAIYQNQSQYVVMFVSEHYVVKAWPTHERRHAQARSLVADAEYILPARFDDSQVPGMTDTVGFIDLRQTAPIELARLIREKLGK